MFDKLYTMLHYLMLVRSRKHVVLLVKSVFMFGCFVGIVDFVLAAQGCLILVYIGVIVTALFILVIAYCVLNEIGD